MQITDLVVFYAPGAGMILAIGLHADPVLAGVCHLARITTIYWSRSMRWRTGARLLKFVMLGLL